MSKSKNHPLTLPSRRKIRVINLQLWDSALAYDSYSFRGDPKSVNPRNPFQLVDSQINYDLDSEDELQELLGEEADSQDEDDYDSECQPGDCDGRGNDLELVTQGFIVPDDYVSDSSDSDVSHRDGENEAEHEIRKQQKAIEKEQKKQRHVFIKRLEDRMKQVFKLGVQMKPTVEHESLDGFYPSEYQAVSLTWDNSEIVQLPLKVKSEEK